MPYVTCGKNKLFYREQGSGNPLLLVHGWPASSTYWSNVMEPLALDHRVIAVDLKGFGLSDKPDEPVYSMANLADDLALFLDALGIPAADVIGHSMGGMTSYAFAIQHPARVKNLIAVSAPAFGPTAVFLRLRLGLIRPLRKISYMVTRWRAAGKLISRDFTHKVPVPDHVLEDMRRITFRSGIESQLSMQSTNLLEGLSTLPHRTLIMHSDQDRVITPFQPIFAKSRIANSRLEVIRNCGHCVSLEEPDAFMKLVREFLTPSAPVVSAAVAAVQSPVTVPVETAVPVAGETVHPIPESVQPNIS